MSDDECDDPRAGVTPRFRRVGSFTAPPSDGWNQCTKFGQSKRSDPLAVNPYPNLEEKRINKYPGVGKYTIKRSDVIPATFSRKKRTISTRYRDTCGTMPAGPAALEMGGGTRIHDSGKSPGPGTYNRTCQPHKASLNEPALLANSCQSPNCSIRAI